MDSSSSHLHVVQSIEPLQGGGLGRAALGLHRAFLEENAASQLVTTFASSQREPEENSALGLLEFPRFGPDRAFFSPRLRSRARDLVSEASTLHTHGFYVATNWILGREARRRGRPMVNHPHGFFEPWILRRSCRRKRIAHLLFEDANFAAAKLWRALTEREADQIRAQGIKAPIVIAPNGVDVETFDAPVTESAWKEKERRRLLFLARLHPKKGLDLLIPAWASITFERQGWELIIAGPDEAGHRAEAEGWVRDLDLEDSVRFLDPVTGADKVALLRSSDAFVLPSHSEGFSVAILEAMASHRAVVATHACNFPEIARDGGGWLCDADQESLAGTLRPVLSASEEELTSRGHTARRFVETHHAWPTIADTILDACRQHCS